MIIQPRSKKSITGYSTRIVEGWTINEYPNGSKKATVILDYNATDTNMMNAWDTVLYGWKLSETIPADIFSENPIVTPMCVDITSGKADSAKSPMAVNRITFSSTGNTGIFLFSDFSSLMSQSTYTMPTKIQIEWVVEGY